MCFVFHAWKFGDVIAFENVKFDYLKNKKGVRSEIKNIFLVSQVLFIRDTNQTSKNVADATLIQ